ncbi:hypothetical protein [Polaromonas sp.]|uniref:hypothetical protein n=1 Tax=Polaromonas sp. TaxID=1869339 RepID=UPI0013B6FBE7|nr:hypothetical protein [Polaromonas sp.]NDP63084.1 hypothetical protein [Polaromonas sp.]
MRIIGFSNAVPASAQPSWLRPVQALAPWLGRVRDSLGDSLGHLVNLTDLPDRAPAPREVRQQVQAGTNPAPRAAGVARAFTPATLASNEATFAMGPSAGGRQGAPLPQAGHGSALRVVRESDSALQADCAGRMVMSGKIADICAELDRMALRAARAER